MHAILVRVRRSPRASRPGIKSSRFRTGAQRIVIDTFSLGDGSRGRRTASSPFGAAADYDWRDDSIAESLYHQLMIHHDDVSWSAAGFAGIPGRFSNHKDTKDTNI